MAKEEGMLTALRNQMVQEIAAHANYVSAETGKSTLAARVMEVMGKVPRHEFVPVEIKPYAYANVPLPIGHGKTISQPFIVALMTDLLDIHPEDVVLEIGTGLGYQAAVLAELAAKVYSVEILEELEARARKRLERLGYRNVETRVGNGYYGWSEYAPFDKLIVTAAPELIPAPLIAQLKPGGKMVIPAGLMGAQQLMLVEKQNNGRVVTREVLPVRFAELEDGAQRDVPPAPSEMPKA
jgi:protein-L-isoaspartate(D-aspartate) O-methyltransferase